MTPELNIEAYDLIGIGIGPFNLGLAAICDGIPELKCLFVEQRESFDWHSGLLFDHAQLQTPFFADLVTLVDPRSKFGFLNFLKCNQRLFRFAYHEKNFISRVEYNEYCQWVCGELSSLRFNCKVETISFLEKEDLFKLNCKEEDENFNIQFHAKNIVIGTGTNPHMPECVKFVDPSRVCHSSEYLHNKSELLQKDSIAIIGSGQSAAEIFYDLIQLHSNFKNGLFWFTKAERFYPMDFSRLNQEMTSADYIDHFFSLDSFEKQRIICSQGSLYKGINHSLINSIYDQLFEISRKNKNMNIRLFPNCELTGVSEANDKLILQFHHKDLHKDFVHQCAALILATGYQWRKPKFLDTINDQINWTPNGLFDVNRNYSIDTSGKRIFVQNAELHTHGFSAPDLGMGPYRNATILNAILGYEKFSLERNITFQCFGIDG